jgi:hypothetical protein
MTDVPDCLILCSDPLSCAEGKLESMGVSIKKYRYIECVLHAHRVCIE